MRLDVNELNAAFFAVSNYLSNAGFADWIGLGLGSMVGLLWIPTAYAWTTTDDEGNAQALLFARTLALWVTLACMFITAYPTASDFKAIAYAYLAMGVCASIYIVGAWAYYLGRAAVRS